ncbi:hypothetical protein QR680_003872 [Steinernema hermaphroditum]|uniref:Uncharacterized protein n=1 Tax=Steinernema hermaphroditum TaxID=289476 RepID=A0AA39HLW9_9BILA|nr:hypothetical protein QR680_003872 [Steinernema hermaphroditum]
MTLKRLGCADDSIFERPKAIENSTRDVIVRASIAPLIKEVRSGRKQRQKCTCYGTSLERHKTGEFLCEDLFKLLDPMAHLLREFDPRAHFGRLSC